MGRLMQLLPIGAPLIGGDGAGPRHIAIAGKNTELYRVRLLLDCYFS